MIGEQEGYRAYLLRLWQVRSGGKLVWRAALENAHTGERQAFASLEQLFTFLSERCGNQLPDAQQEGEEDRYGKRIGTPRK